MTGRMVVIAIIAALVMGGLALAQSTTILAKPDEQARMKPVIDELKRLDKERTAKIAALPEAQAVRDAEQALAKARASLEKVAADLPETTAWQASYTKLRVESYRIQAAHGLSSLEYQPQITEKGELAFVVVKNP